MAASHVKSNFIYVIINNNAMITISNHTCYDIGKRNFVKIMDHKDGGYQPVKYATIRFDIDLFSLLFFAFIRIQEN